jgi:N-acetylglutamate synthase-like GNAT family acetyltransferase
MSNHTVPIQRIYPGVSIATSRDLSFVADLQKRFSNQLGFLPRPALQWYLDNQRVMLARENGQAAGYVLGRASMRYNRRIAPITQTAVCLDLQRSKLGLSLVEAWTHRAAQGDIQIMQCWCRSDIVAIAFWEALGFQQIMERWPENARQESMILFRRPIVPVHRDVLRAPPPVAGWKAAKVGMQQTMFDTARSALIL